MNYDDFEYVQNVTDKHWFCFDINRGFPPSTEETPWTRVSKKQFNSSDKLKEYIESGFIKVVTNKVIEKYENQRVNRSTLSNPVLVSEKQKTVFISPSEVSQNPDDFDLILDRPKARSIPKSQKPIMVDENEGSRALGAPDSHLHTAHLNKNYRKGAQKGILVDDYDDQNLMQKAIDSRTSYLVEDENRARPRRDQRMARGEDHQEHEMPKIEVDKVPMAHLYETKTRVDRFKTKYTSDDHGESHKKDTSWMNNPIVQERMKDQIYAKPHDHSGAAGSDVKLAKKAKHNPFFNEEYTPEEVAVETREEKSKFSRNQMLKHIMNEDVEVEGIDSEEVETVEVKPAKRTYTKRAKKKS